MERGAAAVAERAAANRLADRARRNAEAEAAVTASAEKQRIALEAIRLQELQYANVGPPPGDLRGLGRAPARPVRGARSNPPAENRASNVEHNPPPWVTPIARPMRPMMPPPARPQAPAPWTRPNPVQYPQNVPTRGRTLGPRPPYHEPNHPPAELEDDQGDWFFIRSRPRYVYSELTGTWILDPPGDNEGTWVQRDSRSRSRNPQSHNEPYYR